MESKSGRGFDAEGEESTLENVRKGKDGEKKKNDYG